MQSHIVKVFEKLTGISLGILPIFDYRYFFIRDTISYQTVLDDFIRDNPFKYFFKK